MVDTNTERQTGRQAQLSNIEATKVRRGGVAWVGGLRVVADSERHCADVPGAAGDAEDAAGPDGGDSADE